MARDFTKNTANYLKFVGRPISAALNGASKICVHIWAFADTLSTGAVFLNRIFQITISNGALTGVAISTGVTSTDTKPIIIARSVSTDAGQTVAGTAALPTGVWVSLGGVVDIGADTMKLYRNGSLEATATVAFGNTTYTNGAGTGSGADAIGVYINSSGVPDGTNNQFDGALCEAAAWKMSSTEPELSAAEFSALASGVPAPLIRPQNLIFYAPLYGGAGGEASAYGIKAKATITGSVPFRAHAPRVAPYFLMNRSRHPRVATAGGPPPPPPALARIAGCSFRGVIGG